MTAVNTLVLVLILALVFTIAGYVFKITRSRTSNLTNRQKQHYNTETGISSPLPQPTITIQKTEYNGVIFGPKDRPLIQVTSWMNAPEGEDVALSQTTREYIEALVQPAVEIARTGKSLASKTYEIVFHPDVQSQLDRGTASLMNAIDGGFHPVAVASDKSIIAVGSAHPCTGMTSANIALGVWQVMALVTSQKFLADISHSLGKIGQELNEIKNLLREEAYDQIEGNISYLHDLVPVITDQNYDADQVQTLFGQLETIIRETHIVAAGFRKQQEEYSQKISSLKVTGRGYKQHKDEIEYLSKEAMRFAQYQAATLRVWGIAAQSQCALPTDPSLPAAHLKNLFSLCEDQDRNQKQWFDAIQSKIADLESTKWNPQQVLKARKEEMHKKDQLELQVQLEENYKEAELYLKSTCSMINAAQEFLQPQPQSACGSMRLIVTLDENQRLQQVQKIMPTLPKPASTPISNAQPPRRRGIPLKRGRTE